MDLEVTRVGDHIALWRLNRPSHNAYGGTLLRELIEASRAAQADDSVRAVVTTGAGPSFCVGADVDDLSSLDGASLNAAFHHGLAGGDNGFTSGSAVVEGLEERGIGHWVLEFLRLDKPMIAAVNGPAAGGGFCLALLHDLRVMAPSAILTPGFTAIGLAPEMGMSWLLPRLVGQARTTELLLLNPRIGAEEALRSGLVHRVAQDPLAEAIALAERIAALSPAAVAATLRLVRASGTISLPEQLDREYRFQQTLWETQEARTAIAGLVARLSAARTDTGR